MTNKILQTFLRCLTVIVILYTSLINGVTLVIGFGILIGTVLVRGKSLKRIIYSICFWCLLIGGFFAWFIYIISDIGLKIYIYMVLSAMIMGFSSLVIGICLSKIKAFLRFTHWLYGLKF